MYYRLRRLAVCATCFGGLVASLFSGGCGAGGAANAVADTAMTAQAAVNSAETTAVQIVQATAQQVLNIPQLVFNMATGVLTTNGTTSWGQPEKIIVTDSAYVFVYPTSNADLRANHGIPHMVVIMRNDQTDPTRRI